ncbi:MAG: bis(5'-nucleosyl)-tetraphosphatase (symmetrical) YqeK [Bacillota bacterium]|nr:bis(5'-nucleosyl)-tetraphosphatase (symmetrical) YqeK [Bacillota bacterium]
MNSTDHERLKEKILEYIRMNLKESRLQHTYRVAETAVAMARREGADVRKAEIAALLHDCARNLPPEKLNSLVEESGLPDRYRDNVNLSHSKVGAAFAGRLFNIDDREILDAISYHTTGRCRMTTLEKIVFLADAIEPGRDYPGVEAIRDAAEESLDRGCLKSLEGTIEFLKAADKFIDNDTIEAFNDIKEKIG